VSLALLLGIGLAGGLGALARFTVDGEVASRLGSAFPFGTLAVNLTGSFLLGLLAGAALGADAYRLSATGVIGAYTTFSTWALESHRLAEDGEVRLGWLNFGVSLALGIAAVWIGREVGRAL
jgi:fluoride exporter